MRITSFWKRQPNRKNPVWIKPRIYFLQLGEALKYYPCACQENKREGHFDNHEPSSQRLSSTPFGRTPRSFVQLLSQIAVRGRERRCQAGGDGHHKRNEDGEGKHRAV